MLYTKLLYNDLIYFYLRDQRIAWAFSWSLEFYWLSNSKTRLLFNIIEHMENNIAILILFFFHLKVKNFCDNIFFFINFIYSLMIFIYHSYDSKKTYKFFYRIFSDKYVFSKKIYYALSYLCFCNYWYLKMNQ